MTMAKAEDKFKIYYQEKLWELIPGIYRHEDGLPENQNPHVLRAIVEVIAEQAAILRRSQDRLWEDQFIEWCNDWAVSYIGDLVGTKLLSALNTRGRRIDVAKTIYYRRRKGTPRLLEELIHDISGWDGKLVEGFQRLVRARHGLDPAPGMFAGRLTGTAPGGVADLRSPVASELSDGPFEEYFHHPDFRRPRGLNGRYGIPKINFYLYRLLSFPLIDVTPFMVAPDFFLFDPSGRDIHLFSRRNRPVEAQWESWHSAAEWELPLPIRCKLLGDAQYRVNDEVVRILETAGLPAVDAVSLRRLNNLLFKNEAQLRMHTPFLNDSFFNLLIRFAIITECGKLQLLPASISVTADAPIGTVSVENITAANLTSTSVASDKILAIDPVNGRFEFLNSTSTPENVVATYHYGFSGRIGAGTYDRRQVEDSEPTLEVPPGPRVVDFASFTGSEIAQIVDNGTYEITSNPPPILNFMLQAKNMHRPLVVLTEDLVFTSAANDATLVLDGIWFGSPGDMRFNIIIQGDFESVTIRNCTFDPGNGVNGIGETIFPVSFIIDGVVETICIEKCIMGPIVTGVTGAIDDEICILDSIIQAELADSLAVSIASGKTTILRATIFGAMEVHRLYASEVIATKPIDVLDTQNGCFRFSAAPDTSRIPRPYESFLFESDNEHWFTSRSFGHYGYAQLSDTVPTEIFRGGENGAEMGGFNSLINSIKSDGLRAKVEEYMPFGLIPSFINIT